MPALHLCRGMSNLRPAACALLLGLMLAACGGGGGGGGGTPETAENQPPQVRIEAPGAVAGGETAILDGSASFDPDGRIVSYSWSQTSGVPVTLDGSGQAVASFTAPMVGEPTSLTFSLTLTDNAGASSTGATSISVQPAGEEPRFTISGRLETGSSQALDLTTNDPFNVRVSNNSINSAQPLPNPVTVGGYLNEAGSGAEGRSQVEGDVEDFYRVELFAGQAVTLLVANAEDADADLYLYDESGNLVDFSIDTSALESVSVPADGLYFVNVSLFSGATIYNLAIGSGIAAAPAAQRYANVLSEQAIVRYQADSVDPALDPLATERRLAARHATRRIAGGRGRDGLFHLPRDNAGSSATRLRSLQRRQAEIADDALRDIWRTLISIKRLALEPGVAAAEPNYRVTAMVTPNDEAYPLQWHYPIINLPAAWQITSGSPEVIVAVVDTGILSSHPDLLGQLVPGYDFISDPERAGDGDGIDPDPEDIGAGDLRGNFHGTHVSGTVAAAGNNRIGGVGAAWGARVMPLRALGTDGSGTSYDIAQAVRYAAGLANDSGTLPAQTADVINLSLGGESFSQISRELYREVRRRGISVVAAAGNESSNQANYPARYPDVFSVSAIDAQRNLAPYSNRGPDIDLAAPGGDSSTDFTGDGFPDGVLSTDASDGRFTYSFTSGTSMAAPHVSAVLALMKSANRGLQADDIARLLAAGALTDDAGEPGRDDSFGLGIINARKAVDAALGALGGSVEAAPSISASSSVLNFGSGADTLRLVISGTGNARVTSLTSGADWLSLRAESTDRDGFGRYEVSVDRGALAAGIYRAEIQVRSTANTLRVQALLAVGDGQASDLGTLYVLLYDPETDSIAAQTATRRRDAYEFQLPAALAGSYLLFAGSDINNDLRICDTGEACGALLTLDQPLRLRLDRNLDGISFPVEYQIAIPGSASTESQSGAGRALQRAQ